MTVVLVWLEKEGEKECRRPRGPGQAWDFQVVGASGEVPSRLEGEVILGGFCGGSWVFWKIVWLWGKVLCVSLVKKSERSVWKFGYDLTEDDLVGRKKS